MLTTGCIHPDIMAAIALCGHGSKILIADGNYPLAARSGNAKKVYLGVSPGLPTVTAVLSALLSVLNVEKAEVMLPEDGTRPEIFDEFAALLPKLELTGIGRYPYYDACEKPEVCLAISTGEKRVYANILLTVGVA